MQPCRESYFESELEKLKINNAESKTKIEFIEICLNNIEKKIDRFEWFIITTMVSTIGTLLMIIYKLKGG